MHIITHDEDCYIFENLHLSDLNPLSVGHERCRPEKSFGPAVRPYVLIHYVKEGKGQLTNQNGTVTVTAGHAFIIRRGEVTTYRADRKTPWDYYWVTFNGELAKRFEELPDVIKFPKNIMEEMFECGGDDMCEYKVASLLFKTYVELFGKNHCKQDYARQVCDYIDAFYMRRVSVGEIAENINLDRRYLSRIFKEKTGVSIQDHLINRRIAAAQEYMTRGFSVKEAAIMSGYEDICNFSKMFKRKTGKSPAAWKKENRSKA